MLQQNNDSKDAGGRSKTILKFKGDMEFRALTTSKSGSDPPEPYEDIPAIGPA